MFKMDLDHFMTHVPFITGNDNLRKPQIEAYERTKDHFLIAKSTEHAQVILPTGTGKTGLMGLLPYGLSQKRVLIITPQLVIKDAVLGSLDPEYDKNFWIMTKAFEQRADLPSVIEYETHHERDLLQYANIVIVNVQKLQKRLSSTLLKKVEHDFFDLIIIDEAHHAEAKTWTDALEYFRDAKVIKVTGTPFRGDGKKLEGKVVYEYKLSEAMERGYVKTLERIEHIPDDLRLTIDKDDSTLYTVDEIREKGLKDEDWINRSVALSPQSNNAIADKSIEILEEKLAVSDFPHKIIAVACSIWHAEQLQAIYEAKGYSTALVHSKQDKTTRQKELDRIERHEVQIVINVALLGEGYDHKYLSVAAIFRPYKGLLPYAQFIGRVLRSINSEEGRTVVPEDNIAAVVYHQELGLESLWKYYKQEVEKKDIISKIREDKTLNPNDDRKPQENTYGDVVESGSTYDVDSFIPTEVLEKRQQRQAEEDQKVKQMMVMLDIPEAQARQIYKQTVQNKDKERLLRPDLFVERTRKYIDKKIKFEIVPDLLVTYGLDLHGTDLKRRPFLFTQKYRWIVGKLSKNGELLAVLLENRLNDAIGGARSTWAVEDWPKAEAELDRIVDYLRQSLDHGFGRN